MLEGREKSSQRACSAKRNFPVWNLFCVYEEESISHSEKYLTLDPVFRALANSWQHSPSSESACLVVPGPAASEGWAGGAAGKGEPSLGCSPLLEPVTPTASSSMVSPHTILFLLHFFLCLLPDSPSSGDDEDDDDESEDTGNLFFWETEAFSLKKLWFPSSAAHLGVHVVAQQLFHWVEISDFRM